MPALPAATRARCRRAGRRARALRSSAPTGGRTRGGKRPDRAVRAVASRVWRDGRARGSVRVAARSGQPPRPAPPPAAVHRPAVYRSISISYAPNHLYDTHPGYAAEDTGPETRGSRGAPRPAAYGRGECPARGRARRRGRRGRSRTKTRFSFRAPPARPLQVWAGS